MSLDNDPTTAQSTQFNHPMSRRVFAGILRWRCNTVKGAGQDIQKGGEKMEDAAKKRQ